METNYQSSQVKHLQPAEQLTEQSIEQSTVQSTEQSTERSIVHNEIIETVHNVNSSSIDVNSQRTSQISHRAMDSNQLSNQLSERIACEQPSKMIEDVDMRSVDATDRTVQLNEQIQSDNAITCAQLADCLLNKSSSSVYYVLIDTRSFIEYNSCHIQEALNVCCSKIIKRRLQNDKVRVTFEICLLLQM